MKQFEAGKTYYAHSMLDYDQIFELTVLSRTASTITAKTYLGTVSTYRINKKYSENNGAETITYKETSTMMKDGKSSAASTVIAE